MLVGNWWHNTVKSWVISTLVPGPSIVIITNTHSIFPPLPMMLAERRYLEGTCTRDEGHFVEVAFVALVVKILGQASKRHSILWYVLYSPWGNWRRLASAGEFVKIDFVIVQFRLVYLSNLNRTKFCQVLYCVDDATANFPYHWVIVLLVFGRKELVPKVSGVSYVPKCLQFQLDWAQHCWHQLKSSRNAESI